MCDYPAIQEACSARLKNLKSDGAICGSVKEYFSRERSPQPQFLAASNHSWLLHCLTKLLANFINNGGKHDSTNSQF